MSLTTYDINTIDMTKIDRNEVFALDTNVLYWIHYSQASDPNLKAQAYQVVDYSNFIEKLLENGNRLVTTVLNISELAHVVENSEYRLYNALNTPKVKKKEFRNLRNKRVDYQNEMKIIMLQLQETYGEQIQVIEIEEKVISNFIHDIDKNACDVFDYVIIKKLIEKGIINFISDDKDFVTIEGINLYTSSN